MVDKRDSNSMSSTDKHELGVHVQEVPHHEVSPGHAGDAALDTLDHSDGDLARMAARGREAEQSLTLGQAFRKYRWAVFWSITVSMVSYI